MENNENLNNQINESNNVKEEKKNNSKTIGLVILIIGLLLVGLAVYKLFIENPSSEPKPTSAPTVTPTPNNNQSENDNEVEAYENNSDSELLSYELDETNKKFIINGKVVLLKVVEDESFSKILYINNQKTDKYYYGKIYLSKSLIIIEGGGQSGSYSDIIDENGKIIMVSGNPDNPGTSIEDLRLENGKLVATKYHIIDELDLDKTEKVEVELVFENGMAQFKEMK